MSTLINRGTGFEDTTVEATSGIGTDGLPAYAAGVTVRGAAVRESNVVFRPDGTQAETQFTIWYPPDASPAPALKDRVTVGGETMTVEQVKRVERLNGTLDHIRVLCQLEGVPA